MVHGGAGGVGSAAIQLGLVAGARVIATAGGSHHTDVCRQLGSDAVIDYDTDDFVTAVKDLTSGRGADVIYDPIGGEVFDRSRRCIAFEGRLLVIGFVGGRIAEVPTNHVLIKNYSVLGLHWGLYRTMLPDFVTEVHRVLMDLHSEGRIAPLIGCELPMEDAVSGLQMLVERTSVGKVIVLPAAGPAGRKIAGELLPASR